MPAGLTHPIWMPSVDWAIRLIWYSDFSAKQARDSKHMALMRCGMALKEGQNK